jgi:hypothetical protein
MKSRPTATVWIALALCASLCLAVLVLVALGPGERGTDVALQLTARLSFLLFWPAYAGGALTALFGPAFQPLKQHSREFGLAFASAFLVHIGLVAWLCYMGFAPARGVFIFFGIAVLCTYLLALFSVGRLQQELGRRGWWLLRTAALNYIAYAFFVDFWKPPFFSSLNHLLGYSTFAMLSLVGPLLRVAAFIRHIVYSSRKRIAPGLSN